MNMVFTRRVSLSLLLMSSYTLHLFFRPDEGTSLPSIRFQGLQFLSPCTATTEASTSWRLCRHREATAVRELHTATKSNPATREKLTQQQRPSAANKKPKLQHD